MILPDPFPLSDIARIIATGIILVGLAQNLVYMVQLGLAGWVMRRNPPITRSAPLWRRYADQAPPVALLSPAFNEEKSIVESTRSMLALQYPSFEVIVVNDGSSDATLQTLIEAFGLQASHRAYNAALVHAPIRAIYTSPLFPKLVVIDKENGGKADALNAGINVSRAPVFCSMDADSILESDALLRAMRPFVEDPGRVIAVGGTVRLANGCSIDSGRVQHIGLPRNWLARFQCVEYLRAFLMARLAWSEIGALTIISGAFGLFAREPVMQAGGYARNSVGEDMELVVRLHRTQRDAGRDYRIAYVPEPVCWTEAPESLRDLARQRSRWHRGSLETFMRHKDMFMRPKYGRVGSIGFLNILLTDVLGPVTEVLGLLLIPLFWATGLLSADYLLAFLALSFTFGIALSVCAIALEEIQLRRYPRARDLLRLTLAAILENLGYRQLNNLWRMRGWFEFATGRHVWGTLSRKGFSA